MIRSRGEANRCRRQSSLSSTRQGTRSWSRTWGAVRSGGWVVTDSVGEADSLSFCLEEEEAHTCLEWSLGSQTLSLMHETGNPCSSVSSIFLSTGPPRGKDAKEILDQLPIISDYGKVGVLLLLLLLPLLLPNSNLPCCQVSCTWSLASYLRGPGGLQVNSAGLHRERCAGDSVLLHEYDYMSQWRVQ